MEALGSVDKAIDVLFHLHRQPGAQGVTAIGRALGLPKSSAHRLLAALGSRGLVERDDRGQYRPGMGLVALGLGALEREPVVAAAMPVLEEEAEALGETVFLVGARAGRPVVLGKAEGTGFLRAAPRVGEPVPVHATAVGKLFLAFGGGAPAVPEGELERFTARTRTSAATLERPAVCATVNTPGEAGNNGKPGAAERLAESDGLLPAVVGAAPRSDNSDGDTVSRFESTANVQANRRIGDAAQRLRIVRIFHTYDAQAASRSPLDFPIG